jgi:UDP-glucose 4-epimerase
LAAFAYVGESVTNPSKYYINNVVGTLSLLEAMRAGNVSSMVFSSTCAVYGVPTSMPITEETAPHPVNPYGASKLMIERILADFHHAYGLKYIALRYFNAAGSDPENEIGEIHDPEPHLIPLILDVALGRLQKLAIFGNTYPTPDGTCIRDYIHVTDLARAHVLALKSIENNSIDHASINLGTGKGHSILELLKTAEEITGKKIPYSVAAPRGGDPPELIANPTEAMRKLSWKPEYPEIRHGIQHAWNFRKKTPYLP